MDLVHKMQHRSPNGEADRYVIIKYYYSNPLTIEVQVDGKVIQPFPFKKPEDLT